MKRTIAQIIFTVLCLAARPAAACDHTQSFDDGNDESTSCEVCKQECEDKEDGSGRTCLMRCKNGTKRRHHFTCSVCGESKEYGGYGACTT